MVSARSIAFAYSFATCCMASSAAYGVEDGLLGNLKDQADAMFVEFVAAREDLGNDFATLARGRVVSLRENRPGLIETEHRMVEARYGKDTSFTALSIQRAAEGPVRFPRWEQMLVRDGTKSSRSGSSGGKGMRTTSEKEDVDPEDSVTRRSSPRVDPYFWTVSDVGTYLTGKLTFEYGSTLLRHLTLESAKRDKQGNVVGLWRSGSRLLELTFSPKQGNRPIRAVWSTRREDEKGNGTPQTLSEIRWVLLPNQVENDKEFWLPVEIERIDIYVDGKSQSDHKFKLEWKKLDEEFPFPSSDTKYWLDPFTQLFEIDWTLSFDEYESPYATETSDEG